MYYSFILFLFFFDFFFFFFFFSSRRRHTRWNCDWSSDVCSSDLGHTCFQAQSTTASRTSRPPCGYGRRIPILSFGCRSEEHTSELQSQFHLVCRLLLEKKNSTQLRTTASTISTTTAPPAPPIRPS